MPTELIEKLTCKAEKDVEKNENSDLDLYYSSDSPRRTTFKERHNSMENSSCSHLIQDEIAALKDTHKRTNHLSAHSLESPISFTSKQLIEAHDHTKFTQDLVIQNVAAQNLIKSS